MAIDDNTSYELTGAQVKDLANKIKGKAADNTFVGATSAAPGSRGLVPEPQAGDDTKFLSGDGTWQTVPTVYNGALAIQQNGTTLDTFTANSSDDKTVNIQTITAETVAPADEVGAITASMIDWSSVMDKIYPVGSIYMSSTMSTVEQVQTALGGTWVAWGEGRVPVGVDASDADFNTVEETGGEKTHTLTIEEMPIHSHNIYTVDSGSGNHGKRDGLYYQGGWWGNSVGAPNVSNTGGSKAHNNLQPYITCYMYKRTA